MFELKTLYCPSCGTEVREKLHDNDEYACPFCTKVFHVMMDEHSRSVGFVSVENTALSNPLWLPKGSIRAATTILLALCCWILILMNFTVPGYLLSLLLTVTGYYFAFRKKNGTQDRFYDVTKPVELPLSLPSGSIRNILIAGFFISAVVLMARKRFMEPAYVEFFLILTGLVVGHLFSKIIPHIHNTTVLNFFNHLKGFIVLGSVISLTVILFSGQHESLWHIAIALACIISFYFGSRS